MNAAQKDPSTSKINAVDMSAPAPQASGTQAQDSASASPKRQTKKGDKASRKAEKAEQKKQRRELLKIAINRRGPIPLARHIRPRTYRPAVRFVPRRSPNRKLGIDLLPHRAATTVAAGDAPPVGYLSPSSEVPEELDEDEEEDEDAGVPAAPHAATPSSTRRSL